VKKIALAGFFLLLLVLGITYTSAHRPAASAVDAAVPVQSGAIDQAGDAGATGTKWITVRDTRENAFSIQVPQGWKTYGGLFRFSTIDTRMIVDMTSPDGLTNLRVGDSTGAGGVPCSDRGWRRIERKIKARLAWCGLVSVNRYECVGEIVICAHEPQHAAQDPSFRYNI
jgi:hypothetical protein